MRISHFYTLIALAVLALQAPAVHAASDLAAVANFFETPRIDMVSLSPKGAALAMAAVLPDGTQGIVVRDTADPTKAKMVTRFDPLRSSLTRIYWINEKRLGYTLKNVFKNAVTYLDEYAIDTDGDNLRHLISGDWRYRNTATGTMVANRTLTTDYNYYSGTEDGSDDIMVEKTIWNNVDPVPESSRLYRLNTRNQLLKSAYDGTQPPAIQSWVTDRDSVPRIANAVIKGDCITYYRKPQDTTWAEIDKGS